MNAALIGISGWGDAVLNVLRAMAANGELRLVSVSDIQYEQNLEKINELGKSGTLFYQNYREMLAKGKSVDIVAIATPIHLHKQMSIDAMEAGFHVLLEKPPAVTIQDVDAIIETSERTSKWCAVDFLNSSSETFRKLKRCISGGMLGNILTITGVGLWKRLDNYYSRTNWAGKLALNGSYVLDGTVNNPLSHLLNNMLLLGQSAQNSGSAEVARVTGELYHAHDIEGEDTSCLKVEMGNGIQLYFYATLCHNGSETPYISVEGTKGTAYWDFDQKMRIKEDGEICVKDYLGDHVGNEDYIALMTNMFRNLCAVASGGEERLFCSVQDTRNFILASNGAFESSGGTHGIPERFIERYLEDESAAAHISGIRELILRAAEQKKLFSEIGVEWAIPGRAMDMTCYRSFNMKF